MGVVEIKLYEVRRPHSRALNFPRFPSFSRFSSTPSTSRLHSTFHCSAMAKRRKNRTHLKGGVASAGAATIDPSVPKSFVIRHGQVGRSLSQLVRDVRQMMEPHTASRLKVQQIHYQLYRLEY
jgi:hypothetical protein